MGNSTKTLRRRIVQGSLRQSDETCLRLVIARDGITVPGTFGIATRSSNQGVLFAEDAFQWEYALMESLKLRSFLFWCLVLNSVMFGFWALMLFLAPDLVYRTQHAFLPISESTFQTCIYCMLGIYKLLIIFFNLVPYVALRLSSRAS